WFARRLGGEAEALIAERDGAAVGYVVFRVAAHPGHVFSHPRRWLEVDELGVAADAQRTGCGRALMQAVQRRADELGLDRIELSVRAFNAGAIAFYRAIGFEPAALRMAAIRRDAPHFAVEPGAGR